MTEQKTRWYPYNAGYLDAVNDNCENRPFACVGGIDKREQMEAPEYIPEDQREEYLRGYRAYCDKEYGKGWETTRFVKKKA